MARLLAGGRLDVFLLGRCEGLADAGGHFVDNFPGECSMWRVGWSGREEISLLAVEKSNGRCRCT